LYELFALGNDSDDETETSALLSGTNAEGVDLSLARRSTMERKNRQ
jgi:hypothetical protein